VRAEGFSHFEHLADAGLAGFVAPIIESLFKKSVI
jgi:hypothetical protein